MKNVQNEHVSIFANDNFKETLTVATLLEYMHEMKKDVLAVIISYQSQLLQRRRNPTATSNFCQSDPIYCLSIYFTYIVLKKMFSCIMKSFKLTIVLMSDKCFLFWIHPALVFLAPHLSSPSVFHLTCASDTTKHHSQYGWIAPSGSIVYGNWQ